MVPALRALIAVLRTRTETLVALPEGEQLVVEEVHDEPWWAFNYYLGDLRSRVVVNSDQQTTAADLVTLAAHEAFPGHHTDRVVKEQLLVREQGFLEESIQLVPTPQSLVGEGIAELGLEIVMDDELRARARCHADRPRPGRRPCPGLRDPSRPVSRSRPSASTSP